MLSCGNAEHLKRGIIHAIVFSDINQVKIRLLCSGIHVAHCDECDAIACYQIVPITFEETRR